MAEELAKKEQLAEKEAFVEFVPFGATDRLRLTASMVRQFIAVPTKSGAFPSERDCIRFIMLCCGKRANPFEGDCYLIGYDTEKGPAFSMVCGIDLFLKRAEASKDYDGIESGVIIVDTEKNRIERPGALVLTGEELVGGWAKVYRKDHSKPDYKAVNFATFDTGLSRWKKDPAGMIEKVARSQALRSAYPMALGGLYTQEEMEKVTQAGENLMVIEAEPISMPIVVEEKTEVEATKSTEIPEDYNKPQKTIGIVRQITEKMGKTKKGADFKKWNIAISVGGREPEWYSTFNTDIGKQGEEFKGRKVQILWTQDGQYKNITAIASAMEEETPEQEVTESEVIKRRIAKMKEIDPDLYVEVIRSFNITPMSIEAVEIIEKVFSQELDKKTA